MKKSVKTRKRRNYSEFISWFVIRVHVLRDRVHDMFFSRLSVLFLRWKLLIAARHCCKQNVMKN
ncbi:hypothetical protein HanIR_Chr12g0568961 [Helianthus annuus]|nr:hypothetical protein HanIR_Chr12g0568961 [Helianthus annuus]